MKAKTKQAALTAALALLTAASVTAGSLFDSPAALLSDDGGASASYSVGVGSGGADDDDAGAQEDDADEARRRGGLRAMLRRRILALPLAVRLLAVLPLWGVGTAILAAATAAWPLLQPVVGKIAGFALLLALLLGCFALAAKAAFPDLPLKKLLNRRSLMALALSAAGLALLDAVLGAAWGEYARWKNAVLSAAFFLALCAAAVPFALREQKRRLAEAAAPKPAPEPPKTLTFTDAAGTFSVTIPNVGRGNGTGEQRPCLP